MCQNLGGALLIKTPGPQVEQCRLIELANRCAVAAFDIVRVDLGGRRIIKKSFVR